MDNLGQVIMTGISGQILTNEEKKFIEKENIGGVILFSQNFESPAQLAELVNSIQKLRKDYPLFIAVDQEGGRVQRFKGEFSLIPSMADLARLDSPKVCFEAYQIIAKELKACGVNLNLAPVCDIFNNPKNRVIGDRSFGKDVDTVTKFVSSAIRGLQTESVLACAKHFPGHGCTIKDSHHDLPVIEKTLEELQKVELLPFVKAAKSRVSFMMMSHILVKAFDEEHPISLSKNAHEYVRNELKFKKVIISDDMQMKAVADKYTYKEAAVMAINAGTDLIEYRDMEYAVQAYEGLQEALKKKEIKNEVILNRISQVMAIKREHLKTYSPIYIPEISKIMRCEESRKVIEKIQESLSD